MKNAICLAWGRRAVVSPHIGDLGSARSLDTLVQVAGDLQRLYQVRATRLLLDAHPGYGYRSWARATGLPITEIAHHRAHASALAWEFPEASDWIVFAWDGVGLGDDGTLWGGEAFTGRPGAWRHAAALRRFRLPGADQAGRQPWRSAVALLWEHRLAAAPATPVELVASLPDSLVANLTEREQTHLPLLAQAWLRGLNSPATQAVGRLFDGAAALIGVGAHASFEGEAPMRLEALARAGADAGRPGLALARDRDGLWRADWAPLLGMLIDPGRSAAERAWQCHAALADSVVEQAERLRQETGADQVGLTGGVFQNRLLTERALAGLERAGLRARLPARLPVNDAGVAFGQVMEFLSAGPAAPGNRPPRPD